MAMNAAGVTIRVDAAVLNQKADEVSKAVANMEQLFGQTQQIAERTRYYWVGEAGDLHRRMFAEQKEEIDIILKRLKEHPVDLQIIAKTYQETERHLTETASQLSSNLID